MSDRDEYSFAGIPAVAGLAESGRIEDARKVKHYLEKYTAYFELGVGEWGLVPGSERKWASNPTGPVTSCHVGGDVYEQVVEQFVESAFEDDESAGDGEGG